MASRFTASSPGRVLAEIREPVLRAHDAHASEAWFLLASSNSRQNGFPSNDRERWKRWPADSVRFPRLTQLGTITCPASLGIKRSELKADRESVIR